VLLPAAALCADGRGMLGDPARRFLGFLADAGFSCWQMLPVHPVDAYGSPYQALSVHAGDPRLIDESLPPFPGDRSGFEEFSARHAGWLHDFALFCAIRAAFGGQPWWEWPEPLRHRDPVMLEKFSAGHAEELSAIAFGQYRFFSQWAKMRRHAAALGIMLVGDLPLFAALDSADVWARRDCFRLDASGRPEAVAGVPPDYFSATGQRWGNPLYDWERMREQRFEWWVERMQTELDLFDALRLDHFRGLESTWEIPADHATAEHGQWRPVPGRELLMALRSRFGRLPLIAEDLGLITPEVERLRRSLRLPGMKVLQFAFDGGAGNPYLPHNHEPAFVVYTGTHDNNTTVGWFEGLDHAARARVYEYLGRPQDPMPWPLITAALASVCRLAVIPVQDLLGLGAEHRTNTPGTTEGNWRWRLDLDSLTPELTARLRHLNALYGRN